MKNVSSATWWIIVSLLIVFGLFVLSAKLQDTDPSVVAKRGIHWHPQVNIFVDDEKQVLPANIGIDIEHKPMHTHEDADEGWVHMEYPGKVQEDDTKLKWFFDSWNKDISNNDFGNLIKMTVNGEENTEFGEYKIKDKDIINIYYESTQTPEQS